MLVHKLLILILPFEFREIWNRFLEFESNVGDLASILKVEKRRAQVMEKVGSLQVFEFLL